MRTILAAAAMFVALNVAHSAVLESGSVRLELDAAGKLVSLKATCSGCVTGF